MAAFYLVRHGEPDCAPCDAGGFIGHGRSLAPLTARGRAQAALAAEVDLLAASFSCHRGVPPPDAAMRWETLASLRARMRAVADRYADYGSVILVSHGMALRTIARVGRMQPGEVAVCRYARGQADCVYDFV